VETAESTGAIEIEGRRFAWRAVGAGPPLLLINGYAATGADWDPTFVGLLAADHEVICPDNRGLGDSELGDGELTVDGMAADLEALLDARGVDSAPVVGWSMGGFVAQQLARRVPGRVEALTLISTDPGGPEAAAADPAVWTRLTDCSGSAREQASRLIALLFPPALAPAIDRDFGEVVAAGRATLAPAALRAQEAAMEAWHRGEAPSEPGADGLPTLVVHGDEDEVIPAANAKLLAKRWPGARVEIVAGAAHAVMAQEAERVAAAIATLLTDRR
jgi:pimeloyl-ACP methyl ester carboxylesterase